MGNAPLRHPPAAVALGVSQTVTGLTIVAAGTSMPELVTSLVTAYRGRADLAIGNVVGEQPAQPGSHSVPLCGWRKAARHWGWIR